MITLTSRDRHVRCIPKSPSTMLALLSIVATLAACESRTVAEIRQPAPVAAVPTVDAVTFPAPAWSEFDLVVTPVESVGAAASE
jgi:hypothetical protein